MRTLFAIAILLFTAASADARIRNVTDPDAPRALPMQGQVQVSWSDPAQFTDLRASGNRREAARGTWVEDLASYLRDTAQKMLPPGQQLDVRITDIRRAGLYEPWHGPRMQDIRVIRDHYPPRMDLQFTLTGSDGKVLAEGERKLVDSGFMMRSPLFSNNDPLRFEKTMINDWLKRELAKAGD